VVGSVAVGQVAVAWVAAGRREAGVEEEEPEGVPAEAPAVVAHAAPAVDRAGQVAPAGRQAEKVGAEPLAPGRAAPAALAIPAAHAAGVATTPISSTPLRAV